MDDFQRGLKRCWSFVVDGSRYAHTLLEERRERAMADIYRLNREELLGQRGGCMVRVFPTDFTKELKRFSEEDHHVLRCIDALHKNGLNAMDMFLEGLVRQFSENSREGDETTEAELEEIDTLRDDFEATLLPHLERCIQLATLNAIRYGFTPLGYKTLDDGRRVVPYVPLEFVVVRLQPSGRYVCRGIDQQEDQGPFELFFFRSSTDEERPNSDLSMLLPLRRKLLLLREAHDRSLMIASRPYIVTSDVQENRDKDDLLEEEKRERQKTRLRQRMLREEVNQGTSTAFRLGELAAAMSTDACGMGGAEELSGSGFLASARRRTHQEMEEKLCQLKARHHKEKQKLREDKRVLEELMQRCVNGRAGEAINLPVQYELPKGSTHVGSHLNVRPNALNYDTFERLYEMEVTRAILGETLYSKKVNEVGTRQGLSRALVAAMGDVRDEDVSVKSVILQRFLIRDVLSAWLAREHLPMKPVNNLRRSMGLQKFQLMDRILPSSRMKLWLMCNTGHRASDISMGYRQIDPYRTGQAVIVPQSVVSIATAEGVAATTDGDDDDGDDYSEDGESDWGHHRKRARR